MKQSISKAQKEGEMRNIKKTNATYITTTHKQRSLTRGVCLCCPYSFLIFPSFGASGGFRFVFLAFAGIFTYIFNLELTTLCHSQVDRTMSTFGHIRTAKAKTDCVDAQAYLAFAVR